MHLILFSGTLKCLRRQVRLYMYVSQIHIKEDNANDALLAINERNS